MSLKSLSTPALAVGLALVLSQSAFSQGNGALRLRPVKSFGVPVGIAEIVDATGDGNTLVYTNFAGQLIGVVDITDIQQPTLLTSMNMGGEPTSVSIHGNIAVVAVWVDLPQAGMPPPAFSPGKIVVLDLSTPAAPQVLGEIPIGFHPDSVKLTEIGGQLVAVVAIENQPVVVQGGLVTGEDRPGSPNDVSPAGLVQVIAVNTASPPASAVVDVTFPLATMTAAGLLYPADPQPEFVSIHGSQVAVSLQENNGIARIDIANPAAPVLLGVFSTGIVGNRPADLTDNLTISLGEIYPADMGTPAHPLPVDAGGMPVVAGARMPDAVAFTPDGSAIISADEGELNYTGGRGFSAWTAAGSFITDDGGLLERTATLLGHYPDGRSDARGIEVEGVTCARFRNDDLAFILSERGSFMAVYQVNDVTSPRLLQVLPTGISPEGVLAITSRGIVVTADEASGTLTIFQVEAGLAPPSPSQPQLNASNANSVFSALSGLCAAPMGGLYSLPDNALPTEIFHVHTGVPYAHVTKRSSVTRLGVQARYDAEGICLDTSIASQGNGPVNTGWWICSEGNATTQPNLLVQVSKKGVVLREIQLPVSIDAGADPTLPGVAQGPPGGQRVRNNGFEGLCVSADGRYLLAAIQRDFNNEFPAGTIYARIARYDLQQLADPALSSGLRTGGNWEFFFYPLDSNDPVNWAGLSEIMLIGNNEYAVIERDKGIGVGSTLKKVYAFSLAGLVPDADGVPDASDTIAKVHVVDAVAGFFPYEKIEGLAIEGGDLWIGLDNDGGIIESRLVNMGPFVNPL